MILKVSNGNGGWHFFDRVERIHTTASPLRLKTADEISAAIKDAINLVPKESLRAGPVEVWYVDVHRDGSVLRVMFIGGAYLCNDGGNTIERIGSKMEGRRLR